MYIDAKANDETICELFGMSPAEYISFQMESLQNYVAAFCMDDVRFMTMLLCSDAFQGWYMKGFQTRNWLFIHKYCLRTYRRRVIKKMKPRQTLEELQQHFRAMHRINPDRLYPTTEVLKMAKSEMGGTNA
jgi:hypothetical protein